MAEFIDETAEFMSTGWLNWLKDFSSALGARKEVAVRETMAKTGLTAVELAAQGWGFYMGAPDAFEFRPPSPTEVGAMRKELEETQEKLRESELRASAYHSKMCTLGRKLNRAKSRMSELFRELQPFKTLVGVDYATPGGDKSVKIYGRYVDGVLQIDKVEEQ